MHEESKLLHWRLKTISSNSDSVDNPLLFVFDRNDQGIRTDDKKWAVGGPQRDNGDVIRYSDGLFPILVLQLHFFAVGADL